MAVSLIVFTYLIIWKTNDTGPLTYLVPSVFGLVTTSHGFYFWKAKAENMKNLVLVIQSMTLLYHLFKLKERRSSRGGTATTRLMKENKVIRQK